MTMTITASSVAVLVFLVSMSGLSTTSSMRHNFGLAATSTANETKQKRPQNFQEYVSKNFDSIKRSLEVERTYVPSYEGTITIGFSIHVPYWELDLDRSEKVSLESLVMLFLCSQNVDMVVTSAADPNALLTDCPFQGDIGGSSSDISMISNGFTGSLVEESVEDTIVWNLPKFTTTNVPFHAEEVVEDMASQVISVNTNPPFESQQYYTRIFVTYPVYQFGAEDASFVQKLQNEFDSAVIRTGVLDSLLPWPNALSAAIGSEPYVFWDEPLPDGPGLYDTTIPLGFGTILQYVGYGIIAFNTFAIVLLSLMASCHSRRRKEINKLANVQNLSNKYLDTEAGVSALLMDSQHYALSKSSRSVPSPRRYRRSHSETSSDGLEAIGKKYEMKNNMRDKESGLLRQAKAQSPNRGLNTPPWLDGKGLLGSNEEDNEAERIRTDVDLLNLSGASQVGSSLGDPNSEHSKGGIN